MKSYIKPSTITEIGTISENLRQEDVDEIAAHSGDTPKSGLLYCFFMSKPCMTMVSRNGYLMGAYGVVPEGGNTGRIWMLGCDRMVKDKKDKWWFLGESRRQLAKLQLKYPLLFNVVDARNEVHIKWLQWMGFTFIKKYPQWGPESRLFYEFVRV